MSDIMIVKKEAVPQRNLGSPPDAAFQLHWVQQQAASRIPQINNENSERKMAFLITEKTLTKNAKKITEIEQKNLRLQRKLDKVYGLLEALGDRSDVFQSGKQLNNGPNNIVTNVEDSSTESECETAQDTIENQCEDIKIELVDNDLDMTIDHNEEESVEKYAQMNNVSPNSQVQVTFLAGSDTAKEGLLKRKLKQLAENDIVKSKKIRELNNIIFIKNKVISELKEEISRLKENNGQKQMQLPVLKILHQTTKPELT